MAIKQTASCDRCGEMIHGTGFSASFFKGSQGAVIKTKAEITSYDPTMKHFCGKTCLVHEISDYIDEIPGAGGKHKEEKVYATIVK